MPEPRITTADVGAASGACMLGGTVLDAPPNESERRSWLYLALWAVVIFCTIPFARALRKQVDEQIGLQAFLYVTILLTLLGAILALRILRRRQLPLNAYVWLITVSGAFIGYALYLRDIPEEAIHVAEYGVLGVLAYRALVHRIRDYSVYVAATLVVGIVGTLDEYIQWVVPSRYFDLRDVRTNFIAGALAQVAIAGGLRPSIVASRPSTSSLRRLCFVSALTLALLSLSFLNTPHRVRWYATRLPFLSFLLDSRSMMTDYGYRYRDPEIGVFQSRFSHDELEARDRLRGSEVALILDRYIGGEGYDVFLNVYSVPRDPYVHEAGVHLFRRNRYLERTRQEEQERSRHATVALREDQILEKYYPTTMQHSVHRWNPDTRAYLEGLASKDKEYVSLVSWDLLTRYTERNVVVAFAVGVVGLILLGFCLRREQSSAGPRS